MEFDILVESQLLVEFAPRQIISRSHTVTERHENELGTWIVDCVVHLYPDLGPELLETVYEVTFGHQATKVMSPSSWLCENQGKERTRRCT